MLKSANMIICKFENGFETTNARHAVADGIVARGDEILLVRRGNGAMLEQGKLALPGGFMEHDESVKEAVKREIKEETGYETRIIGLLFIVDSPRRNEENRQNISFVFLLEAGEKTGEPDHEVSEVMWRKLNDLPPEKEFAFDYYRIISEYKSYLKEKHDLPRFVSK